MNLHASQSEIDVLEDVLRRSPPGEGVVATKVALAWHLRQRDSGRTLQLVQDVMPVVRASRASTHGDAVASCHARAALAAAEASALFGETVEAERCLVDARAHLDPAWDPQAEGDAWLVESLVARLRGQAERLQVALRQASHCFARLEDRERLEVAQAWIVFERTAACPAPRSGASWPGAGERREADAARDAIMTAAQALELSCTQPAAATRLFSRAGDAARARGLVLLELLCMLEGGAAIHGLGDVDRAARCFDAAALRARVTAWPQLVVLCDIHIGALLCDLGAFDESRRTLGACIESLSTHPRGAFLAGAHAALARTLLATQRIAEAVAQMDAAMALLRLSDGQRELAGHLMLHARVLAAASQPGRAVDALAEARTLVEAHGFGAMRAALHQAEADLHHRFALAPPAGMTLPSPALHHAEAALAHGQRLTGWSPRATLLDFLAERWAETGDHERAYGYARRALAAKERETAQKMSYPLALLRVRRHAEVRASPTHAAANAPGAARSAMPASRRAPRIQ
jgi:hypothetical protein